MNNKFISIVVVIILIAGGFLLFKNKTIAPTDGEINNNMPVPGSNVDEMIVTEEEVEETTSVTVKEFSVDTVSFSFSPSTITVNKGDTVKITVKNINGTHDLKIDEFNTSTRVLKVGETETITFLADKTGTFEYYCSVGNHRAMGMVGTLTVR
ncbi:MAG: hypothetical protein A3C70_02045 [Candidatus Zambryskibacteria bacterium RIFCSPHIGHO2_02_FULL_43_14]|uniref:EfeO-type cupredoxin-like domain-containing protein n=1 Tax=Candidatus Zambryskibacteria bacterium RIFCSPHIGHO2_02_FULL_43_14 TaxID=1802748 RepID=A0A1G2THI9_9BACT|nr:MAG: hypothetical protein A2829_01620 [Candidatus Zambryskibacteria bacterium RIFCSPHIGHO2_01_FULL_43_60]OHA96663.1 MAG: hypothetical protein A3C70_02045 [Candidatus Zambryskibacteria bacterium RIFCSPHIGHO2_02_FULL_43_14]OHB03994.1 MAG: hypothetical protein A3B03_00860 [Candidatus Zambryskibacteria bacterium RIFCSPLOWO2_01_FULL_42_41]